MFPAQVGVGGGSGRRVLRGEGAAAAQIATAALARVIGDAFPKQAEHDEVPVLMVDARAAKLDELRAQRFKGAEIKLLLAVVAEMARRRQAGLETIGADDFARRQMLDEQMIAHFIERVGIQSGGDRFGQALVQFQIEHREAQPLRGADFGGVARKAGGVGLGGTGDQARGLRLGLHHIVLVVAAEEGQHG